MQANRRGERVAAAGGVLQLALAALAVAIWWFTRSAAVWPAVWLILAPVPFWIWTLVLFYCRRLQRREQEELSQLAARGASESIFTEAQQVRPAANRVRWMERYLAPIFTLLVAGYHIALGVLLLRWLGAAGAGLASLNPSGAFFFALGGAFVAFLFSRYATGMAKVDAWRPLRAPGSYLFATAVVYLLLAVGFALDYLESGAARVALAYAFPLFMLVVGAEMILNFILDIYRPRIPGAEHRFGYDSRLLNLIASPESIGHSIAEALNYQFGFEVSRTWFYQLLQRAFVPLILAGVAILWLLTSVVVVEEGQQYVVLHWGRPRPQPLQPRALPYLNWPWPIDTARRFETGKVHEIQLGVGGPRPEAFVNGKRIYLWGEEHGNRQELDVLVAMPSAEGAPARRDVPSVGIVKMVVAVYYRILDPYKFGYTATDAPRLLEDIANREMVQYAATATMDQPAGATTGPATVPARSGGLLTSGQEQAADDLKDRIAGAVRRQDLGVEILDVKLLACHPPREAAPDFEAVIAAEREQDKVRYVAQAYANKALAEVAGNPDVALRLAQAINMAQELEVLISLRRAGGDLAGRASQGLIQAEAELRKLDKEIEAERLLGKLSADQQTIAQTLRARLARHADLLKQIHARPQDFAGGDPKRPSALEEAYQTAQEEMAGLFKDIEGQAAVAVASARAYRWQKEFDKRAEAETFGVKLAALRAAPSLYRLDKYLQALTEVLGPRRKYILGLERDRVEVWMNLEQPAQSFGDIKFGKNQ